MKQPFTRFFLLATYLLLSYQSRAQYTQTITGALTAASPVTTWRQDLGNTARCGQPGYVNATGGTTPIYSYASHLIRNAGTTATCVTVTLTAACDNMRTILLVSAFTSTYNYGGFSSTGSDYATLLANYLGNPGERSFSSPSSTHTTAFPLQLEAGAAAQLIVSSYDPNSYCSSYTLTITSAQPLPVLATQSLPALAFYPNPVREQAIVTSTAATTLTLRDALGRVAQTLPVGAGTQQVKLEHLPAGIYSLTDEATHQTTRLVKAAQ
jgi:hypothetical protein